jgi:hypothetical protein
VEEVAAAGLAIELGRCREFHDQLAWMRAHKHTATRRLRLVGTDVPGSGGSPLPALEAVAAYLREADRDALPLAERAIDVVRRYHDPATFTALGRYTTLDPAALRMGRRHQRPTRGARDAQGQSCVADAKAGARCSNGLLIRTCRVEWSWRQLTNRFRRRERMAVWVGYMSAASSVLRSLGRRLCRNRRSAR